MPNIPLGDALFQDSEWADDVEVYPKGAAENHDGYAVRQDDPAVTIHGIVRPRRAGRAVTWERGHAGIAQTGLYTLITQDQEEVSLGDHIKYRGEFYEINEQERAPFDDFGVYELEQVTE